LTVDHDRTLLSKGSKNCTVETIHDVHDEHEVYFPKQNIEGAQQGMSRRSKHLRLYAGKIDESHPLIKSGAFAEEAASAIDNHLVAAGRKAWRQLRDERFSPAIAVRDTTPSTDCDS
jgi:hypothetical protein